MPLRKEILLASSQPTTLAIVTSVASAMTTCSRGYTIPVSPDTVESANA
jgi:hypothetical protein